MSVNSKLRGLARGMGLLLVAAVITGVPLGLSDPAGAEDPVITEPVTPEPSATEPETPEPSATEPADPEPVDPDPPAPPPPPYSPKPGALFNDPSGTVAEQYALNTHLVEAINHTPPGATIRMALYSGSIPSFRDAVIAARRRGVNVRLVIDGHGSEFTWWKSLVSVLGSNRTRKSFATVCPRSCFDTRTSTLQHSKLYLFSTTGTVKRVSVVGSGNPTYSQATKGWNDLFTLVGNQVLYDGFAEFFDAMVRSARTEDNVDYYRTVLSGDIRAIISPAQSSRTKDYYGRVLNNIRCTAAPGSGVRGRTKVTVAMGLWSRSRVGNAERLWQLDEAGCDVEAIVSTHDLDYKVRAWLRKPGRHGGITFRAASMDINKDGKIDRYLHEKVVMVEGGYLSQEDVRLTFMGSHNFTYNAFRGNNDIILRSADRATYDQLAQHIVRLRAGTVLVPKRNSAGRTAVIPPTVDLTQNYRNLESARAYGD